MKVARICIPSAAVSSASCTKQSRQTQIILRNSQPAQQPLFTPQQTCQQIFLRSGGQTDSLICHAAATEYGQLADLGVPVDSYLVLGLAHCFEKNDEGKLSDRMVIEPIAANSLECMVLGAKTCFKSATGLVLEDALSKDKSRLPDEFQSATWCSDFEFRCGASARTWLRPHAQDNLLDLVPLGQTRSKFNFNLDEKRVLNFENEVSDEDNIKQDMSIDVYGRKGKDEEAKESQPEPSTPAPKKEEDDDLDSLLSA